MKDETTAVAAQVTAKVGSDGDDAPERRTRPRGRHARGRRVAPPPRAHDLPADPNVAALVAALSRPWAGPAARRRPPPAPEAVKAVSFDWQVAGYPIGHFVGELINFVIIAFAIFILIVKLLGGMVKRVGGTPKPGEPTTKECPECLSVIPVKARRCSHCTAVLPADPMDGGAVDGPDRRPGDGAAVASTSPGCTPGASGPCQPRGFQRATVRPQPVGRVQGVRLPGQPDRAGRGRRDRRGLLGADPRVGGRRGQPDDHVRRHGRPGGQPPGGGRGPRGDRDGRPDGPPRRRPGGRHARGHRRRHADRHRRRGAGHDRDDPGGGGRVAGVAAAGRAGRPCPAGPARSTRPGPSSSSG